MNTVGHPIDRTSDNLYMKVGLLIYGDINSLSGGYLYDRKLVSYLQQQGDSVDVISLPKNTYFKNIVNNFDPVHLLNLDIDILVQDELVHPSVYRTNLKIKTQRDFSVVSLVHLLSTYTEQPLYKKFLSQYIEQKYLASVDGLILNSNHSLKQTHELLGDNLPPHIIALPAGNNFPQNINTTKHPNKTSDPLKILFLGNIIQQKGLEILVRSLTKFDSQNIQLTITGRTDIEPSYVKKIRHIIKTLHLHDKINFTGPLTDEDLIRIYQTNDVLVLPSVNEAYGIVYIEAQKFGLPVIGTTLGGAKEIINHGKNGYLITPNDINKLAKYLSMLQQDRELLQKLSKNAYKAYPQYPTWNDSCQKIRHFLQKFLL